MRETKLAPPQAVQGIDATTADRAYRIPMDRGWERALACLKEMEFRVEGERRDAWTGEIEARRPGGDRVRVVMKGMDGNHTLVMVRVDQGESGIAGLLHDRLARDLGLGEPMGAWFGGISLEAHYEGTLEQFVAASREAMRSLDLVLTEGELQGDEARIEARTDSSDPLGIKVVMPKEGGPAKLTFLAGTEKDDTNLELARRLKSGFERAMRSPGRAGIP